MKKIFPSILAIILTVMIAGCSSEPQNLEEARTQRDALLSQKREIDTKLVELEKLIEKWDTATKAIKEISVSVKPIEMADLGHFVKVQGQIKSDNNIIVMPKMPNGIVTAVYVDEGDRVAKGQLLAKMDDALIKTQLDELETALQLATTVYEKQKRLWDQKIGSELQYLQAKNNMESLQKKKATVLEQQEMTKITAPISGIIDKVYVRVGQGIDMRAGGAFSIVNMSDVAFLAEISEAYISKIKRGDDVQIFFPTLNETLNARVSVVGNSIHPTRRTFEIECKLPSRDSRLKANMNGEISIMDESKSDIIALPLKYVQRTELGDYVYIAERNEEGQMVSRKKKVSTGLTYEGKTEITSGLSTGDNLITVGFQELADGQAIKIEK